MKSNPNFIFALLFLALFFVYSEMFVSFTVTLLPPAMHIPSRGYMHFSMDDPKGFVWQLRHLTVIASIFLIWKKFCFFGICSLHTKITKHKHKSLLLICFLSACLYSYISYPYNFYLSDAQFHWVERIINLKPGTFYFAPALLRVPFIDYPIIFIVANGVINNLLFYAISRKWLNQELAIISTVAFAVSSINLDFMNVGEDVTITLCFLLIAIKSFQVKSYYFFGFACFLLSLIRFHFLIVLFVGIGVELLYSIVTTKTITKSKFLQWALGNISTAFGLYIIYSLICVWSGGVDILTAISTQHQHLLTEVGSRHEGFKMSRFSMSYLLHYLWMFPIVSLIGYYIFFIKIKKVLFDRLFMMLICVCLTHIAFLEAYIKWSFNYRYLAYLIPLHTLIGFGALKYLPLERQRQIWGLILLMGSFSTYTTSFRFKERIQKRSLTELYPHRFELRKELSKNVYTTECKIPEINFLSAVFLKPKKNILCIEDMKSKLEASELDNSWRWIKIKNHKIATGSLLISKSNAFYGHTKIFDSRINVYKIE